MASFLMYVLVAVAFFFMGSSDPITCESLNEDLELNLDCEEVNSSDKGETDAFVTASLCSASSCDVIVVCSYSQPPLPQKECF